MKTFRLRMRLWLAGTAWTALALSGLAWAAGDEAAAPQAGPIKIACIGDSITDFNTYETNLQNMLDANYALSGLHPRLYVVRNFGVSGTTALDLSASYRKTQKYKDALAFLPDIVYIQLGTNDSRTGKTYDNIAQFADDYTRLIKSFLALPSRPKIYLSDPPTMPNEGHWGDNDLNLVTGVNPRIHVLAAKFGLPVIDQHTPTSGHPEWVRDNVHPSRDTAGRVMAAAIYRAITGLEPPATMYPPVWFVPTANGLANGGFEQGLAGWSAGGGGGQLSLSATAHGGAKALQMARTSDAQGPSADVKAILLAGGQGDWFLEAWARIGSIAKGSPSAKVTLTITDDKGPRDFASDAAPVATGVWSDLRAVRTIAWTGKLAEARLSVTTSAGCADPLLVDDVVLQKYPYPAPTGQAVAPSYLTARPASDGRIALAWTDNSNRWTPRGNTANETGFEIAWATDPAFSRGAGGASVAADTTGFAAADLKAGTTYYFRVRAVNAAGKSAWTNTAAATTQGPPAGPAAPTHLAAPAVAGTTVRLTWTDNAENETGYRVEWATDPDFVNNFASAVAPAGAASYEVTGLQPSSTYAFRVRAMGAACDSAASNVAQKVTWRAVPDGMAAHVAATVVGSTRVDLAWADDCTNETGYLVEYAADPAFTEGRGTAEAKANATSCSVTGLKAGNAWHFRVRAVNALGSGDNIANPPVVEGPNSAVAMVVVPPAPPEKLAAWVRSAGKVELSWADQSDNEAGFRIDRAADAAFANDLTTATVPADATRFTAQGLKPNTTYHFRVRSASAGGESANTEPVRVTTPNAGTPNTPGDLTAKVASSSQVTLAWADHSADETGFKIDRAADASFARDLATIDAPAGATTFTAAGLKPATTYYFRLRAINAAGESAGSNAAGATTLPLPPAAPGPLTLADAAEDHITVTWTDNSDNEEGFRVDLAADAEFTQGVVSRTVGPDVITFTAVGLKPATTHYLRVRAYNIGGESKYSNPLSETTPAAAVPSAPRDLAATAVSDSQVDLFWIDTANNETGFRIDRADDAGFTKGLATLDAPANTTRWHVAGLAADSTRHFRVRAVNRLGASANSNAAATTLTTALACGEAFDGPADARLNGLKGGPGWSGPWKAADTYTLAAGPLAYADARNVTVLAAANRLVLAPSGGDYREALRPTGLFAARMSGGRALDVWFSCLLKPGGGSRDFNPWAGQAYNEGPQAQGDTSLAYANHNAWKGGAETARKAPKVALKPGRTNLILCRLQVPADLHSFTWTWYVNPTGLADPLKTSAVTVWTAANPAGTLRGLNGFAVRCRTDRKSTFEIDEIRYGDSAADVTPRLPAAAAPGELTAAGVSRGEVDLHWQDNSDNETGFAIDRATDAGFTRNLVSTVVPPDTTCYRVAGLAAGTTYYFRLRAANAAGESHDSNAAHAATQR